MDCPVEKIGTVQTPRGRLELADIFREHLQELGFLTADQRRIAQAILRCRTAALGAHAERCDQCGHLEVSYNSCRDRHCPKCQWLEQQRWLEAREQELLQTQYFHTVFTVPRELCVLFLRNSRECLGALFAAVSETLKDVALTPKNLGAHIGFVAVLHTWTQKLLYHPHIHCIVPGGGLEPGTMRWVGSHPKFFLPVRILSDVFRGKLLEKLERVARAGKLDGGDVEPRAMLHAAARKKWVVYSKAPFAGPRQVLAYLGRYTHRIAISNFRLLALEAGKVSFHYRDRTDSNQRKVMVLPAKEFLRRFLLHVLPHGFVRIRHYGFLASPSKGALLECCRRALGQKAATAPIAELTSSPCRWRDQLSQLRGQDLTLCPACGAGQLVALPQLLLSREPQWSLRGRSTLS